VQKKLDFKDYFRN